MSVIQYARLSILLFLVLLKGCAGNIGAGVPFGAALASCSTPPDAARMLPEGLVRPSQKWAYPLREVTTEGPAKSTVPPPILAATFSKALENALKQNGAITAATQRDDQGYALVARMVSQNRGGTFATTTLELTIRYMVVSRREPGKSLWETSITTNGEINDWKVDACKRLRNLQEQLSKENIERLLDTLPSRD
jgi:hypothetical protein